MTELSASGPGQPCGKHVLVVDDDFDIRTIIDMVLSGEGYTVSLASSGDEALVRVVECSPDLVLLDLTMPGMNGWQTHSRLRYLAPGVPVVFMTAAFRARQEAETHGAAGYLEKPFEQDRLVDVINQLLPRS